MATEHRQDRSPSGRLFRPWSVALLFLLAAALVYVGHLLPRGLLEASVLGAVFLAAAAVAFIRFPHPTLMAFGVFVLLQDLLVINLERWLPGAAPYFKFIDELLVLLFFFLVLGGICARRRIFYRTRLEIPILAFVLVSVVGSLFARVPPATALVQLFLYLKGFLLFFAVLQLPVDRKTIRGYGRVFTAIGILVLLGGMVDFLFPEQFRALLGQDPMIEQRYGLVTVKSVFTHPGIFGWFCAFLSLYFFAYYMTFNRARYLLLGLVFSLGSFFSMRRRNLVGIAGALSAGLLRQTISRKLRYGLVLGILAAAFLILAWPKIEGLYRDVFEVYVSFENPDVIARNALYLASVDIAGENFPWGAGLGRFGSWMSQVDYSPVYRRYGLDTIYGLTRQDPKYVTDTFWPAILGETGVLGIACFAWICLAVLFHLFRRIKRARDPLFKAFALGTLMVFIEGLIESLAIAAFTSPPIVYFIFGALGLCFAFGRWDPR